MGCIDNGPCEKANADYGYAGKTLAPSPITAAVIN
ncbi:MAG: hypothetical protein EBT26_00250 [Microbacteriaceae bacterium]|nr:hypothetical protein [Microbacteriaceae bacterium]NBS60480.1 hypothetical protein [Microbacteriaceae bacterium]